MMSRARTLSPGRQGEWFFRDRGRRASRCPQPSGKTDEMAAMIQILCQFHYIDALKASPTGDGGRSGESRDWIMGGYQPGL